MPLKPIPLLPTPLLFIVLTVAVALGTWRIVTIVRKHGAEPEGEPPLHGTLGSWPYCFANFGLVQTALCAAAMLLAAVSLTYRSETKDRARPSSPPAAEAPKKAATPSATAP